ncbi:DNA polymerase III subunit tau [Abditibacteriota bacterium]|nr:DNA polymerase III subunit tau [Abditibacteriota bacterium]
MSLYRKYRPQTFEDVVGQEHVARTLRNALTAEPPRVAHAYLFTGPRGIGKTTNARLLAKCLNCENGPTPTPCNQCDFCLRVANNQPVMDLTEIDAASNTGVDNIREAIIDKVGMAPAEGRYRIYIIDEVHMLSNNAFNALLKTLEEPPAHAIFVLATTDSHKVPATITSRCQRFDFRRVTPPDIAKRLQYVAKSEAMVLHPDAAKLIARHADGALRDALTLLEQVSAFSGDEIGASDVRLVLGGVPQELLFGMMDSVASGDTRGALEFVENAVDEGASFGQLARDLTAYARDLLLQTVGFPLPADLSNEERAAREHHAAAMGRAKLEGFLTLLRESEKEMRQSTDHRLLLELCLVRACEGHFTVASTQPAPGTQTQSVPRPSWREKMGVAPAPTPTPTAPPPLVAEVATVTPPLITPIVEAAAPQHIEAEVPDETEMELESVTEPESYEEDITVEETETVPDEVEVAVLAQPVEETPVDSAPVETYVETEAEPEVEPEPIKKQKKQGRRISSFEELVELWPAVLMRVRKKISIPAVSYLADAQPVDFTPESVVLQFSKEFHHAKATDALGRMPFEDVINTTLDKPRRLKFVLATPEKKTEIIVEEEEEEDEDGLDSDGNGDLVGYAQNVFGADIVGRSG